MTIQLIKAQRKKVFMKLGLAAPSGGGKTLGALLLAYGMMKAKYPDKDDEFLWSKIAIIDTENGSAQLYVGSEFSNMVIGQYGTITLTSPFEAEKYITSIKVCSDSGIEVCIIDSTTHLWSGEGGLLEQQSNAAKRTGNSYTAWRDITPQHYAFVEAMLQTPMHIIATMRSKQEYTQEKDSTTGRTVVRKLGMEPEQRKGMEFEFTVFLDINSEHEAFGAKDRTSMFDQKTFKITPEVGAKIMNWLESGTDEKKVVIAQSIEKADAEEAVKSLTDEVLTICKNAGGKSNEELMTILKKYVPNGNPNAISDPLVLKELHQELVDTFQVKE